MEVFDQNLQSPSENGSAMEESGELSISGVKLGLQLGVLYGRHSVDLCLVQKIFNKFYIRDIRSFPHDMIDNTQMEEMNSKVVEIIKDYLYQNKLQAIPINLGLYGEHIAFRRMQIPAMTPKEISNAVLWEGEKLFPFKFDECRTDFQIVDKQLDENKKVKALGVNITAVKDEIIEDFYKNFKAFGLKLGQVNFLPNFTTKFLKLFNHNFGEQYLHIHVNDNLGFAVFLQNNELNFCQQFMSWPFFDSSVSTGITNIESIATELQSFIDIYVANSRFAKIDSIVISGIASKNPELIEYLNSSTGIPCQYFIESDYRIKKLSGISNSELDKNLPVIASAIANPNYHPLAPDKIKIKNEKQKFYSRLGMIAAASIIITLGLSWIKYSEEQKVELELNGVRNSITEIENSPAYLAYLNIVGKLNRGKEFLRLTSEKKRSHLNVLVKSLSYDIPENLSLLEVHTTQKNNKYSMRLTGHVRIKDFSPEIILARYIKALEKFPYFNNIKVISHNKNLENEEFDLDFQLTMDVQV